MKLNNKLKALVLTLILTGMANAASIDYLSNNSASYFQNPSQTGQISTEGVFYNPAGTVFLEEGIYFNANIQNSVIQESMTLKGNKLASNGYTAAPSFNLLGNMGKYSLFANAGVIAGGATLNYDEGVAGIELAAETFSALAAGYGLNLDAKVERNQFNGQNRYYQLMLGGAYKISDTLSAAGGIKYVHAVRKLDGHASFGYNRTVGGILGIKGQNLYIDSKREADGIGGIIGFNYMPTESLNLALKYETPVKLKFKTKATETSDMSLLGRTIGLSSFYPKYSDGLNSRRDLPGVLSLGISKEINNWTVSGGYIHYFNKAANIDDIKYNDGYEINFGVDYRFSPKWKWHAGVNFAKTGAPRETFNDTEYAINSQIYATGLTYSPTENNSWKFGIAHVSYNAKNGVSERTNGIVLDKSKVKYDKSINVFSVGYTHKF